MTYRYEDPTSKLVDKNVNQWLHNEKILMRLKEEKTYMPIITISRDIGAYGTIIGCNLAKKMNFELFDKQFIETIAENLNIRQEVVSMVEETIQTGINNWIENLFTLHGISTEDYYYHLLQVIVTIGNLGNTVMLGRGCNFILKPDKTLRVRIICPLEIRSQRIAERENISVEQATKDIIEDDKWKKNFIEKLFKEDINNPEAYDIIINTQFIDEQTAIDLIHKAYIEKFKIN